MIFVHEGSGTARVDLRRRAVPRGRLRRHPARHDVPVRGRRRRAALPRLRVTGADRDPAAATATSTGSCSSTRRTTTATSIRRPSCARTASAASSTSKVRVRGGYQTYVLDYHPFDVVGWDGYVYPWTFSIHDFEPITGRIHMPPPVAPDVPGPELRHLLVLPAQARLRPARDPDSVSPLEPEQRGDDLLRRRQLRLAEGASRSAR